MLDNCWRGQELNRKGMRTMRSDRRSQFAHRSSANRSNRGVYPANCKTVLLPLEIRLAFSNFLRAAKTVRAPFGGPAETGAGGVRRLLVPILLNGGFGYEDYLRFCSPLAVDHRL